MLPDEVGSAAIVVGGCCCCAVAGAAGGVGTVAGTGSGALGCYEGAVQVIFAPKARRLWNAGILLVGTGAVGGMTAWGLAEEPVQQDAALFGMTATLALLVVFWRTLQVAVAADRNRLVLVGQCRTRYLRWNEIDSLEVRWWFGGPALFVIMKDGRKRMVPLLVERQRAPELEALRLRLLAIRDSD